MTLAPTKQSLSLAPDDAVDLHLHTLASDGLWTPEGLIDHLAEGNFRVVSVCDHDTQRSVTAAMLIGAERGIRVIPGVEVTCRWDDRQWHILVYGIDPTRTDEAAQPFQACLEDLDNQLMTRATNAAERIIASGRPLPSLGEVVAGRPMWPFHVLSSAIKEGHVKGLKEAAELVVELGGGFSADVDLARLVTAAQQAGGLTFMAHPARPDAVGVMTPEHLARMREEGIFLDGIECHYRSHTEEQTAEYRTLAEEYGLLISCGSDSHAPGQPVNPIPYRADLCAPFLSRFGIKVTV